MNKSSGKLSVHEKLLSDGGTFPIWLSIKATLDFKIIILIIYMKNILSSDWLK